MTCWSLGAVKKFIGISNDKRKIWMRSCLRQPISCLFYFHPILIERDGRWYYISPTFSESLTFWTRRGRKYLPNGDLKSWKPWHLRTLKHAKLKGREVGCKTYICVCTGNVGKLWHFVFSLLYIDARQDCRIKIKEVI